jgi:hypothetical protein
MAREYNQAHLKFMSTSRFNGKTSILHFPKSDDKKGNRCRGTRVQKAPHEIKRCGMGRSFHEDKEKLFQQFLRGVESALPFLIVWVLILSLMAGGAVLQHFGWHKNPVQSSKPAVVSMADRT